MINRNHGPRDIDTSDPFSGDFDATPTGYTGGFDSFDDDSMERSGPDHNDWSPSLREKSPKMRELLGRLGRGLLRTMDFAATALSKVGPRSSTVRRVAEGYVAAGSSAGIAETARQVRGAVGDANFRSRLTERGFAIAKGAAIATGQDALRRVGVETVRDGERKIRMTKVIGALVRFGRNPAAAGLEFTQSARVGFNAGVAIAGEQMQGARHDLATYWDSPAATMTGFDVDPFDSDSVWPDAA